MKKTIITVYYPTLENLDNLFKISKQFDKMYICDNSPSSNFEMFENKFDNLEYLWFGENLGLSLAFNKVLKNEAYAWNDDDYIVFFDQDSEITENYVDILISEYEEIISKGINIGCLGPIYFNTSNNTLEIPKFKIPINDKSYIVKSIITSSMLTTYKNLRDISFWNDKIFLDLADWDMCWRMIENKKQCCITETVVLNHTLGSGEKKIGFLKIRIGNPIREYYQTRECLYLFSEKYVPIKYKIRFIAMLSIRPILHFLFLDEKLNRLHYILKGIKDYRKNVHGEFKN